MREKCGGIFEGKPLGSTSSVAKAKGMDHRVYKPEGGENWNDVNTRVHSFFKEVISVHLRQEEINTVPKILCVTHGGLITEALNVIMEL